MSFTIAAVVTVLLTLSQSAIAQPELLAEEVEAYYAGLAKKKTQRLGLVQEFGAGVTANGTIVVSGTASEFQIFNRVKAVRCEPSVVNGNVIANRKSCKETSYFGINETRALTPGYYILGFENSIYPGFVKIAAGEQVSIQLQQITIPGDGSAKIYRNLTSQIEQKKLFFTQYQLGKSMFSLANYDFGDLYLRKFPLEDVMPNIEYSFCDLGFSGELDPQAKSLCSWYQSKSFSGMKAFFEFNADSSHNQYVPRIPGDAFRYSFERLLVSAPTSGAGSFVNVFPGEYTIETQSGSKASKSNVSIKATTSFGIE